MIISTFDQLIKVRRDQQTVKTPLSLAISKSLFPLSLSLTYLTVTHTLNNIYHLLSLSLSTSLPLSPRNHKLFCILEQTSLTLSLTRTLSLSLSYSLSLTHSLCPLLHLPRGNQHPSSSSLSPSGFCHNRSFQTVFRYKRRLD